MKVDEKAFNISQGNRPKVLLLGNGICRAFGGFDWNQLLDEIKDKENYNLPADHYILPMPIKAILLSNNQLAKKMRSLICSKNEDINLKCSIHWENFVYCPSDMKDFLSKLLSLDFDYILTTNYSYELEAALLESSNITISQISELMNTIEVDRPQLKYLINTFNMIKKDKKEYHIWHIHGEARKPDSMIVGHNYYARLLSKVVHRLTESDKMKQFENHFKKKKSIKIGSWVDAFILGDVYILGLGLKFSEIDLWWLLDQKNLLREISGKTIFFTKKSVPTENKTCPLNDTLFCGNADEYVLESECQKLLMTTYGIEKIEIEAHDYRTFYEKSMNFLFNGMGEKSEHKISKIKSYP